MIYKFIRHKACWRNQHSGTTVRLAHFFFTAFSADLVTLPAPASFFVTSLMTPTETVSTHRGFDGSILTMDASPDLTNLGFSSSTFPERRSIFSKSSENLQAMCAVWQSNTGW